ncbi:YvcK family protein [Candidatus Gracilibacteria bacterium]|nr:YvcK family protein [Candidatus Gracilibacteria bacterium]
MPNKTFNITVIGGGSGTFNVLYGLKTYHVDTLEETKNLAAIIAMTDSGGTTGEIRDKYGVLPPGDIRRAVAALAHDTGFVRDLFEYKFAGEEGVIGGNKIGNIILTALGDVRGSFEAGLDAACKMFDVRGQVLPVTLEDVHLGVRMDDGTEVIGEKFIDVSDKNDCATHNLNQNIKDAFLVGGEGNLNPRARQAILQSDVIVIGPGDFYTSIVPALLSKGIRQAFQDTHAKIVYVANIMTKKGETTHYELPDFIDNIERYSGNTLDYVLVNSGNISDELVEKYKSEEGKKPVKLKPGQDFMSRRFKIIEEDFVNESDVVRHDPIKLAKVLMDVCRD